MSMVEETVAAAPAARPADVTAHMGSLTSLLADDEEQVSSSARGWMTAAPRWDPPPADPRGPEPAASPPRKRSRGLADITNTPSRGGDTGKAKSQKTRSEQRAPPAVVEAQPMSWDEFMQRSQVEFRPVNMSRRRLTEVPQYLSLSENPVVSELQLAQHEARAGARETWLARTEEWNRAHLQALRAAEEAFPRTAAAAVQQLREAEACGRLADFQAEMQTLRQQAQHRGKAAWEDHRLKLAHAELSALQEVTERMQRKKLALQEELRARRDLAEKAAQKPSLAELRRQVQEQKDQGVKLRMRHFELETFCRLHPVDLRGREPAFRCGLAPNKPVVVNGDRGGMTRVQKFRLPAWERRIRVEKGRNGQYDRAALWSAAVAASLLEHCLQECERLAEEHADVQVLELAGDGSVLRADVTCPGSAAPHALEQVTLKVPRAHEYPYLDWSGVEVATLGSDSAPYREALAGVAQLAPFHQLPAAVYRTVALLRKSQGWAKRR